MHDFVQLVSLFFVLLYSLWLELGGTVGSFCVVVESYVKLHTSFFVTPTPPVGQSGKIICVSFFLFWFLFFKIKPGKKKKTCFFSVCSQKQNEKQIMTQFSNFVFKSEMEEKSG